MKPRKQEVRSSRCLRVTPISLLCISCLLIIFISFRWLNREGQVSIPIFAVSLARETKRRDNIRNQLQSQEYTIIDACDGKNLSSTEREIANQIIKFPQTFKAGQIGCFLSHYKIWKLIIQQKIELALIVEDDLHIQYPLQELLPKLSAIENFDIIYLGHWFEFKNGTIAAEFDQFQLRRSIKPYGTHGYLISLRGAKTLIAFLDKNIINVPVDNFLVEMNMKGYIVSFSLFPSVIGIQIFPSTVNN